VRVCLFAKTVARRRVRARFHAKRRLAGFGVCESIEAMTGRAPRPSTAAHRAWMGLALYAIGFAAVCGALSLFARAAV